MLFKFELFELNIIFKLGKKNKGMISPIRYEQPKENWMPYECSYSWDDLKKHLSKKFYKQDKHDKNLTHSKIEYTCKLNSECLSKFSIKRYPDCFYTSYNNIDHSKACKIIIQQEDEINAMIRSGSKPAKIVETLGRKNDQKLIKKLYNQKQQTKAQIQEELHIYDQAGLESWSKERRKLPQDIDSLSPSTVFVPEFEIGTDFFYVMFTTPGLIGCLEQFSINLGYLGLIIDGTYRLDDSNSVLFVVGILTPNRKMIKIAYCLSKSEHSVVLGRLIIVIIELYLMKCKIIPKKIYILGDFATFIDKAVNEIIIPEFTAKKIEINRLCCKVHFEGIRRKIVTKENLNTKGKDALEKEKKVINSYIKLMLYAPSETVFLKTWEIFSIYLKNAHPQIFDKFQTYATKTTTYSLFSRPVLMPFDTNPLEGVNNGIKAKITEYVRQNIGVLLENLSSDLQEESDKVLQDFRPIWETRLRVPHRMWLYAKCLGRIFPDVSQNLSKSGDSCYTILLGEHYAFQTYFSSSCKTQATKEIRVGDKLINISSTTEEELESFFKSDLFFQPQKSQVNLYLNPKKATNLSDCFLLTSIKKLQIKNGLDDSSCSCSDFKLAAYCLHLLGALLFHKKLNAPLAIAPPGKQFSY